MGTPWYTLKLPQLARAWLLSHPGPSGFWAILCCCFSHPSCPTHFWSTGALG